ncbi:hypothetical protein DFR87_07435 [Metallosphaera hakonensis JCM 8857 = DSM 7519]|uniref:TRASH transcription regulator C-terminal prokaryotic domain-containing protein n=1 Tax=Metallosphaera hakonensis JCM 8857 = DSM 7519 TaxID=1293036 RepID=A0A2U9IU34_9CREN|nr:hypothetical protein DFR87_07435 [Metallosphaera hakonensis JCM 8857 = DSM 7519]
MPLELNTTTKALRCDVCGGIIKTKPIVVKTCCNNKPWTFCSNRCYTTWMRDWLRKQEQARTKAKL